MVLAPGDIILVTLPASSEFPPTDQTDLPPSAGGTPDPVVQRLLPGMDPYGINLVFTDQVRPYISV